MSIVLPGHDNYSVIVRLHYDEEVFIQARSVEEALERATKIYKGYKVLSARKYDWRKEMLAKVVADGEYRAQQIAKVAK